MEVVNAQHGDIFYLYDYGGTGKKLLCEKH